MLQSFSQIVLHRLQDNFTEPYAFLVWNVCVIDAYALLSDSRKGVFADFIRQTGRIAPQNCLPRLSPGLTGPSLLIEQKLLGLLELDQKIVYLAVEVGTTAHNLRTERSGPANKDNAYVMAGRKERAGLTQACCYGVLDDQGIISVRDGGAWKLGVEKLPYRLRGVYDHVSHSILFKRLANDLRCIFYPAPLSYIP